MENEKSEIFELWVKRMIWFSSIVEARQVV